MGQDDKIKALEAAITKIEKDFGKGAIMKLGDSGNHMNVGNHTNQSVTPVVAVECHLLSRGIFQRTVGSEMDIY